MGILRKVFKATIMTAVERCCPGRQSVERQAYLIFKEVNQSRRSYAAKGIQQSAFFDAFFLSLQPHHWPVTGHDIHPAYRSMATKLVTADDESYFRTLLLLAEGQDKKVTAFILSHMHDVPRALDSAGLILDAQLAVLDKKSCNMKNKNNFPRK